LASRIVWPSEYPGAVNAQAVKPAAHTTAPVASANALRPG
jgi:hypothetical protein